MYEMQVHLLMGIVNISVNESRFMLVTKATVTIFRIVNTACIVCIHVCFHLVIATFLFYLPCLLANDKQNH